MNLQRLTNFSILLFLFVYLLKVGQAILAPLAFGALFAFMLKPVDTFYEKRIKWRMPAILLTMLTASIPVFFLVYFFSAQFLDVIKDMPSIRDKIDTGVSTLYEWARQLFGFSQTETDQLLSKHISSILATPLSYLGSGFSSTTFFITGLFLAFIYVFLLLYYRTSIKNFLLLQAENNGREKFRQLVGSIQSLIQKYLYGLLLVILILGVLNTLGLSIIGIQHAFFWGFLAAVLAIIPYIGTFIGGLLPFLYALATTDHIWQPIAVVIFFVAIQSLEGNFITPKVVGSTVNVNPLAAILALLVGANLWGISSMVLALPAVSVLKEILKQSDAWRPVGYLLSDEIGEDKNTFKRYWDEERFRLRDFFKKKNGGG